MIETYRNLENNFSIEISKTKKYSAFLSIFRLVAFFIIVAFIAAFSSSGNAFYIFLSLLSLILFGFLIYKHHKTVEKLNVLEKKLKYIQTEIDIKNNKVDKLDTGREFLDEEHPYCKDLDMFGENSFYQYIRRTTTMLGKQRLAHYLLNPLNSKEKIEQRQESIKELKGMLDWRIDFNLNSFEKPFDYSKLNKIFTWLDDKKLLFDNKFIVLLTYLLPVINIGLLVVCSLTSMPWTLFWVFVFWSILVFYKTEKENIWIDEHFN